MRNTNNGQTSDFVRAVTRNRDTTWRGLILALAKGYLDSYPGTVYRQPWLSRGYPVVSQKLHWLSITTVITIATYTVVSAPV